MAGKLRHLQERNRTFWARIAVPKELQPIIGRAELRANCGRDRRAASRPMHAALVEFQRQIDDAREKLKAGAVADLRGAARSHFDRELARHDDERATGRDRASDFDARARDHYGIKLRQLVAGRLDPEEAEALIGWAADEAIRKGESPDLPRPELLQALAGVELDALAAFGQRERREPVTEPTHPLLAPEPAPTLLPLSDKGRSRIVSEDSLKPLSVLLARLHTERTIAPGTADEHRVAVRMLDEFMGEARAVAEITRRDMLAFKSA